MTVWPRFALHGKARVKIEIERHCSGRCGSGENGEPDMSRVAEDTIMFGCRFSRPSTWSKATADVSSLIRFHSTSTIQVHFIGFSSMSTIFHPRQRLFVRTNDFSSASTVFKFSNSLTEETSLTVDLKTVFDVDLKSSTWRIAKKKPKPFANNIILGNLQILEIAEKAGTEQ